MVILNHFWRYFPYSVQMFLYKMPATWSWRPRYVVPACILHPAIVCWIVFRGIFAQPEPSQFCLTSLCDTIWPHLSSLNDVPMSLPVDPSDQAGIQLDVIHVVEVVTTHWDDKAEEPDLCRTAVGIIHHLMVTCAVGYEIASRVVFHSSIEFFMNAVSVLLISETFPRIPESVFVAWYLSRWPYSQSKLVLGSPLALLSVPFWALLWKITVVCS